MRPVYDSVLTVHYDQYTTNTAWAVSLEQYAADRALWTVHYDYCTINSDCKCVLLIVTYEQYITNTALRRVHNDQCLISSVLSTVCYEQ